MTAPDDKPAPELPPDGAELLLLAEHWRCECERARKEVAEARAEIAALKRLEIDNPDLAPLKSLVEQRDYRSALRATENEKLRFVQRGGRIYSTKAWVSRWLRRDRRRFET